MLERKLSWQYTPCEGGKVMVKKIQKFGYLFFVGMLILPIFLAAFSGKQVQAAEKALTISFDKSSIGVGDMGEMSVATEDPEHVSLSVTPEEGLQITKEKVNGTTIIYKYEANKPGSYQLVAKRILGTEIVEMKSINVDITDKANQVETTDSSQPAAAIDSSLKSKAATQSSEETVVKSSEVKDRSSSSDTVNESSRNDMKRSSPEVKGATVRTLSKSDESKLGNLWDYNAYLTGQHSANMADTEGALAVKGDSVFPDDLQTFTYGASFRENNTTIGDPIRADQYVNLLIGGKIDNRATSEWVKPVVENRTSNGKTQGWLLGRPTITDWIHKNLGEWFSAVAYKADNGVIDGAFSRLQAQEEQLTAKLDRYTENLGQTVFENSEIKLVASNADSQVLILTVKNAQTSLELKTLSIPAEFLNGDRYKQIIVSSDAEKIVMNGTSVSGVNRGDTGTYSQLARKLSFYFPKAKSITNYLEDDNSYPDTSKSGIAENGADNYGKDNGKNYYHSFTIGSVIAPNATVVYHSGSINGYVFVKNLHQRDGMEIHNFYNPWLPEIEQDKKGEVSLHKQDSETHSPIAGAEFGIRKKDTTNFIDVQATGEDGVLNFKDLNYGEYEIVETKAPSGYELSPTVHKVVINEQIPVFTLEAENKKETVALAEIDVHKSDATNHADLAGAVFGLRGLRDHDFIKLTTDEHGDAQFKNLALGYYEIVELTSPDGYQIDVTPQIIYAGGQGQKKNIELTNEPKVEKKGSIQLTKIDASTGEPLKGVEFGVRAFGQRDFIKKKTDENGVVNFSDLKPDTFYTVAELTTLDGYELTPPPLVVQINENAQDVNIGNWTNQKKTNTQKGSLKIVKSDKTTGKTLAGALFGIRALGQKEYQKGKTNEQGDVQFTDLAQGIYEVRELKAPNGYAATNLVEKVSIGYDTQTPTVTLNWENEQTNSVRGSAKIIKIDEDGKPLAGAEFALRNDHEREFSLKTTTNEIGEAYFNNLPLGKYEVIETKAPTGYQIDGTLHHLVVSKDQQTDSNTLTLTNKKKSNELGQVVLEKRDKETNKVLSGVLFDLEKSDGTVIKSYKTDKFGRIFVKDLPFGTYQFVEKKSLPGYELDQTPLVFTVNKQNVDELLMLSMTNKPKTTAHSSVTHSSSKNGNNHFTKASNKTTYPKTNDSINPLIMYSGVGILVLALYLFYKKKLSIK